MNGNLPEELAALYSSNTIAFGVLVKAVRDALPADQADFFVESITGPLQMLQDDPATNPQTAKHLAGYRMAADLFPATR